MPPPSMPEPSATLTATRSPASAPFEAVKGPHIDANRAARYAAEARDELQRVDNRIYEIRSDYSYGPGDNYPAEASEIAP